MQSLTVAECAVDRLSKLGITDCFGLPGDFAFLFDDAIANHPSINWLGCSNELNASYAADGYARIRGGIDVMHDKDWFTAKVTTNGELEAATNKNMT